MEDENKNFNFNNPEIPEKLVAIIQSRLENDRLQELTKISFLDFSDSTKEKIYPVNKPVWIKAISNINKKGDFALITSEELAGRETLRKLRIVNIKTGKENILFSKILKNGISIAISDQNNKVAFNQEL